MLLIFKGKVIVVVVVGGAVEERVEVRWKLKFQWQVVDGDVCDDACLDGFVEIFHCLGETRETQGMFDVICEPAAPWSILFLEIDQKIRFMLDVVGKDLFLIEDGGNGESDVFVYDIKVFGHVSRS